MSIPPPEPPEVSAAADAQDIARRVESGEYFREMRNVYAALYLDPMSERYFYMAYTCMCVLIFLIIGVAFAMLFPLKRDIPFWYWSDNVFEENPVMRTLARQKDEEPNLALKRFLAGEYVQRREAYDINTLEFNVRFVKGQSTPEVYDLWQKQLDPGNPDSPISQFQRHSIRKVSVISATPNQDGTADVVFDATVLENQQQLKKTRLMATLAFQYADVTIDQATGGKTPVHFLVTDYRTRRLQE